MAVTVAMAEMLQVSDSRAATAARVAVVVPWVTAVTAVVAATAGVKALQVAMAAQVVKAASCQATEVSAVPAAMVLAVVPERRVPMPRWQVASAAMVLPVASVAGAAMAVPADAARARAHRVQAELRAQVESWATPVTVVVAVTEMRSREMEAAVATAVQEAEIAKVATVARAEMAGPLRLLA
jgi:hypothetical protein